MSSDYQEITMNNFYNLNRFPRGSKNEKNVSDYLMHFAKDLNLSCAQNDDSDVVIYKPAQNTRQTEPVILQAHMDMVCAVDDNHTDYDFIHNPVSPVVDGNIMSGRGTKLDDQGQPVPDYEILTSLGADDGIGVASIMTILMDTDTITHPPIIAIFTTGEEIGMVGAKTVTKDLILSAAPNVDLSTAKFINVDEEQDGRFCYGCAGGAGVTLTMPIRRGDILKESQVYAIKISGLLGGHSGVDIDKHRANANHLVGRILNHTRSTSLEIPIISISGGTAENAIANRADVVVAVKQTDCKEFEVLFKEAMDSLLSEYAEIETDMKITLTKTNAETENPILLEDSERIIDMLYLIPNDVLGMIECDGYSVVETSNNVGTVAIEEEILTLQCAARSFYDSKRDFVIGQIRALAKMLNFEVMVHDAYTGWVQISDSTLKPVFENTYQELFGAAATGRMVHAGLECGVFTELFGDIDMIACGPTIKDVHTINEKLEVDTVPRIIELLVGILKKLS